MYDDNFGWYDRDGDEQETVAFYRQVQSRSVSKTCRGCGHKVRILPQYAYCNSCADAIERGWDVG